MQLLAAPFPRIGILALWPRLRACQQTQHEQHVRGRTCVHRSLALPAAGRRSADAAETMDDDAARHRGAARQGLRDAFLEAELIAVRAQAL